MQKRPFVAAIIPLFFSLISLAQAQPVKTFRNPLFNSGADPWCIYRNGYYYYTHTTGNNITLWKTKTIAKLKTAENKIVFNPPQSGPYSHDIWAPEIHYLDDKWYIYFAADSGYNSSHRLWVLENTAEDPLQGEWQLKGKLVTAGDKWSIDGSLFKNKGQLYFIWSGWESAVNGQQNIYISKMKNPWTLDTIRAKISSPTLAWEMHGELSDPNDVGFVKVNEGPEVLEHNNKLFLIYSASGCWTDFYALGMLTASADADIMDSASWTKNPEPVFSKSITNGVYAPGHNSFFKSPDGKEDWILYHANDKPGLGCGKFRSPRAQPFIWKADGTPFFGIPVSTKKIMQLPAEPKKPVSNSKLQPQP